MIFSSPSFLVFLSLLLGALALPFPRGTRLRILAVASCIFYAAWDWRYLGLLLTIGAIDYICAARIASTQIAARRRLWLTVSVLSNIGILGWFKYFDFFAENANLLLGRMGLSIPHLDILLPIGISFYTFQILSYTLDVYREKLAPCRSWLDFSVFATFSPSLIAGPISRGAMFLPQLVGAIGPTRERLAGGLSIFFQGLTKKMLIADRMATITDPVFADPDLYSPASVWCAVLAYGLRIYCDFSGYSDMAIGTARMIGFDLPENFNMPYAARSMAEFWKRWHISLSSWFRDYVFLPLAYASSRTFGRFHLSAWGETMMAYATGTLVTMLLIGLWHGASWNFVLWGGLHGAALAVQKVWEHVRGRRRRLPAWSAWLLTQGFVLTAWVPFAAPAYGQTRVLFSKMLFLDAGGARWIPAWLFYLLPLVLVGHAIGLAWADPAAKARVRVWVRRIVRAAGWDLSLHSVSGPYLILRRITAPGAYVNTVWLLAVFYFTPTNVNPFIYFQF
jgi:alginate O-acetyltransferase complex protein AlgI